MAYDGENVVIQFQHPGSLIAITDSSIDISATSADNGYIVCPIPLMIYAFGLWCNEDAGTALVNDTLLERQTVPAASQTVISTIKYDNTDLSSGGVGTAGVTALSVSQDVDEGDIIYAAGSVFPYLITAPQTLTVSTTLTGVGGEFTPFIIGRWLGIDYRSTAVWVS